MIELDKIQKKIWLCERAYEVSMHKYEEEAFDAVIHAVQEMIKNFRNRYPTLDERDFLALALIQVASQNISENPDDIQMMEIDGRIGAMLEAVNQALGNE